MPLLLCLSRLKKGTTGLVRRRKRMPAERAVIVKTGRTTAVLEEEEGASVWIGLERTGLVKTGLVKTDLVKTDPVKTDPVKTDLVKIDLAGVESPT
mmetsp:Transcript_8822/g.23892  ORF Transcript_8822/g.23892 Transcript_8822/m.23892 type:complete len:96 (-) Transcript_8822:1908-2195(-)